MFTPYTFVKSHLLLNGRLALRKIAIGSNVDGEVALWGRNITNNRDVNVQLPTGDFLLNADFQQARTFGLDLLLHLK